jgi:hypothetical protein
MQDLLHYREACLVARGECLGTPQRRLIGPGRTCAEHDLAVKGELGEILRSPRAIRSVVIRCSTRGASPGPTQAVGPSWITNNPLATRIEGLFPLNVKTRFWMRP